MMLALLAHMVSHSNHILFPLSFFFTVKTKNILGRILLTQQSVSLEDASFEDSSVKLEIVWSLETRRNWSPLLLPCVVQCLKITHKMRRIRAWLEFDAVEIVKM